MAQVVSIAEDLMLASRVDVMLTGAGHHVLYARSLEAASLEGADLVVADLEAVDVAELAACGVLAIGYYSHVDAETKRAADAAGLALAVPRSRMARELPDLVDRVLAA